MWQSGFETLGSSNDRDYIAPKECRGGHATLARTQVRSTAGKYCAICEHAFCDDLMKSLAGRQTPIAPSRWNTSTWIGDTI